MTSSDAITASPTRLRSGEWGARVTGDVAEGDVITITTRAGKSWAATVAKVVWRGPEAAIVATAARDTQRPTRRRSRPCCFECGEWIEAPGQVCWETGMPCEPER